MKNWKNKIGGIVFAALLVVGGFLMLRQLPTLRKGDSLRAGRQIKGVSFALARFTAEHQGVLPPMTDSAQLEALLRPYLNSPPQPPMFLGEPLALPLLARPETGEPYQWNTTLSGQPVRQYAHPEQVVVFYESRSNFGGRLVDYLDGHHVWLNDTQWQLQKQQVLVTTTRHF